MSGFGDGDLLFDGLGDAHGVDGVCRFISGEADHTLDFRFNGSSQDIVRAYDIGPNRFHREKLTGGHLLQSGGVENIIRAGNRTPAALQATHITDVEFDFVRDVGVSGLVFVTHVVLFLLVTGEDADFFDIRCKETLEHSIPERTGTTGDHQGFVFENRHGNLS